MASMLYFMDENWTQIHEVLLNCIGFTEERHTAEAILKQTVEDLDRWGVIFNVIHAIKSPKAIKKKMQERRWRQARPEHDLETQIGPESSTKGCIVLIIWNNNNNNNNDITTNESTSHHMHHDFILLYILMCRLTWVGITHDCLAIVATYRSAHVLH